MPLNKETPENYSKRNVIGGVITEVLDCNSNVSEFEL